MSIGRLFGLVPDLILTGQRAYLRPPEMRDHSEWARLREASRAFLEPWEPLWPADDLMRSAFRHRLALIAEERRRGLFRILPVALCLHHFEALGEIDADFFGGDWTRGGHRFLELFNSCGKPGQFDLGRRNGELDLHGRK